LRKSEIEANFEFDNKYANNWLVVCEGDLQLLPNWNFLAVDAFFL